jgi:restriction endonuclease S subunit
MISEEKIPESWEIKNFGDIVKSSLYGCNPETGEDIDGVPYLRISDIRERTGLKNQELPERANFENKEKAEKYQLEEGDVVIARTGGRLCGKSYIYRSEDGEMVYASYLIRFKLNMDLVTKKYIQLYFQSPLYWRQVWEGKKPSTSTRQNINAGELKKFEIPVPPIDEQNQIVQHLNGRLERIEKLEKSINIITELSTMYKDSIMAFTFANRDYHNNSDIQTMPSEDNIPDYWKMKELGNIASFQNGNDFSKDQWEEEGLPIIRIQNLTGTGDSFNYCSEDIDKRYRVKNGDVLFSWSATIDAFKWSGEDAWLNQHIYRVDTTDEVTDDYMHRLLELVSKVLKRKKVGGTLQHIRKSNVTNFEVPVPPLNEQKQIVDEIEQIDFTRINKSSELLESLFNEYRNSILAHAFRGKYIAGEDKQDNVT